MASKRYAGRRARSKSKQIYRQNRYKSKRTILRKFANFAGKVTYKTARKQRRFRRRGMSRRLRRRIYRRARFRMRRMRRRRY